MTEVVEIMKALQEAKSRLRYYMRGLAQHNRYEPNDDPHAAERHDRAERKLRDASPPAQSDVSILVREVANAAECIPPGRWGLVNEICRALLISRGVR